METSERTISYFVGRDGKKVFYSGNQYDDTEVRGLINSLTNALNGKMDNLGVIKLHVDPEIHVVELLTAEYTSLFNAAIAWNSAAPKLVVVEFDGEKNYKTIGSIHGVSTEVNADSYDLEVKVHADGYVFTLEGQESNQEITWGNQSVFTVSKNEFVETV